MFFRTSKYEVYITLDAITTLRYTVDTNDLHIQILNVNILISRV